VKSHTVTYHVLYRPHTIQYILQIPRFVVIVPVTDIGCLIMAKDA
jgi:hypothetical protein